MSNKVAHDRSVRYLTQANVWWAVNAYIQLANRYNAFAPADTPTCPTP